MVLIENELDSMLYFHRINIAKQKAYSQIAAYRSKSEISISEGYYRFAGKRKSKKKEKL